MLVSEKDEYEKISSTRNVELSEFDTTVIDPMPEADKTYAEMEEDMDAKYDAFDKGTLEQLLEQGPDAINSKETKAETTDAV